MDKSQQRSSQFYSTAYYALVEYLNRQKLSPQNRLTASLMLTQAGRWLHAFWNNKDCNCTYTLEEIRDFCIKENITKDDKEVSE